MQPLRSPPQSAAAVAPPSTASLRRTRGGAPAVSIGLLLLLVSLLISPASTQSNTTSEQVYAQGYCAMYGICGHRSDGKVLNCPFNVPSVKPDDLLSSKIQSLCPTITGNVCCTSDQFDILHEQVQQAIPLIVGCPACLRNFLNLFCELTCSPSQSLFINVTSTMKVNSNVTVNSIDFYVTDSYGENLYNSCKNVKFGSTNTRSMDLIGGGAQNYEEWLAFLGRQADPNGVGSPYAVNFRKSIPNSLGMEPMDTTVYSCGDPSLGCSCGDCPSAVECTGSAVPTAHESGSCRVRIGSLKVKCFDFSIVLVYILLVSSFFVWGILHRRGKAVDPSFETNNFSNTKQNHGTHSSGEKSMTPNQISEVGPHAVKSIQPSIVEAHISNLFRKHGTFVYRNPILILCLSLAVPLFLCIGLVHFSVESRPDKLWVGPGSRAAEEKQYFDTHFAPFYRIEQLILSTIPQSDNGKSPSIVSDSNFKLLFEIQRKIDALRGNYSGTDVYLTDICLNPLGTNCAIQTVLQYFKMDPKKYDDYGGVDHAEYCFEHYSSAETCLSAFQAPIDPSVILGGFLGNNFSEASTFMVTYPVNNEVDKTGNENGKALAWEKAFISLVKEEIMPMVQRQNLTLSFSSESSIQEELKRSSNSDIITIAISYLVMFAYISFTLGDGPHLSTFFISSKVLLGLSGVVVVMLSVLASIGFFSAIGVKSTLIIMEVIPFLVLAVGVDNMCILVHAVKRQPLALHLEGRVINALVEVGPSITLASLSEVLAFAVGSFIPVPAVRVFSMFAALAILLDFLLQVTAFVAMIILDFRRAEDNRVDCFPCIKVSTSVESDNVRGEIGLLGRYMKDVHAPLLGVPGVKFVVIAVFVAFAFASIILCTRLHPGLEQKIVLPQDSYLQDYFDDLGNFQRIGPPLYFVVKDFNYSLESKESNQLCSINQCDPNSLLNEITKASLTPESSYIAKPAASWLDDFLVWLSPEAFSCCRLFVNASYCPPDDQPPCCQSNEGSCGISSVCKNCTTCFRHSDLHNGRPSTAQFEEKLPWFLNALPSSDCAKGGKGAYTTSVDLTGYDSGIIKASAFRTYHTPVNKQSDFVNALKAAREFSTKMSDSLKMTVFPYSVFYIYFEQYLDIWKIALVAISLGLGAVLVVCLVITCSLWTSAIILVVLAMIVLDMMGMMAILGIQLNGISVVNLVMSIGIAVEFCVHITHAFLVSTGDRETRARESLTTMGASVFSGITLTKLVGVIVLRFAKSQVFVVYYFKMYLALVIISFLHGLVFLPVVLSIWGPPSRCLLDDSEDQPPNSAEPS